MVGRSGSGQEGAYRIGQEVSEYLRADFGTQSKSDRESDLLLRCCSLAIELISTNIYRALNRAERLTCGPASIFLQSIFMGR